VFVSQTCELREISLCVLDCVLRVCDPSSCEVRCVIVELWVHLLCFSLIQVHFISLSARVTSSFRGDSVCFAVRLLLLTVVAPSGKGAFHFITLHVDNVIVHDVLLHWLDYF